MTRAGPRWGTRTSASGSSGSARWVATTCASWRRWRAPGSSAVADPDATRAGRRDGRDRRARVRASRSRCSPRPTSTPSSSPRRPRPTSGWPWRRSTAGSRSLIEKPLAAHRARGRRDRRPRRAPAACRSRSATSSASTRPCSSSDGSSAPAGSRRVYAITSRRAGPFPARIRDVGVTIDLATHDVDILSWIAGERPDPRVRRDRAADPRRPRGPAVRADVLPVGHGGDAGRGLADAGQATPARPSSARRACSSSTT